jgi:F-type H+-transporting ATPase subunit delta
MTAIKIYAEGFIEYALETVGIEKALEELKEARAVLAGHPELTKFLESAAITHKEKCSALENIFGAYFSPQLRYFLQFLLKRGRFGIFGKIAEYARLKYAHGKEVNALLASTSLLDTGQIREIKEKAERKLGLKLRLYLSLDPSLLGGVRLEVLHTVIDGSVKKRLDDLKRKLLASSVN